MASTLQVDFKGLVTAPGLLMRSEASCTVADNCLVDAPGLLRKRPGFERGSSPLGTGVHQLHTSPVSGPLFLSHEGALTTATGMRLGSGFSPSFGLATVDGSAVTRAGDNKQRMALMARNHYLTSDEGLRRLELVSGPIRFAGMPRGMAPSQESGLYNVLVATAPTWLAHGSSVAYRATWHRVDGGGVELGGAPTGRAIVRNIAGTTGHVGGAARSVSIRIPVPREFGTLSTPLTTSYFYRLWRSRSAAGDPDDEMYLVAEAFLASADIANGYAVVNDLTPDAVLVGNARLHTNPRNFPVGEANVSNGQTNEDAPPPTCNDVAMWSERLWCADFTTRPAYTAQLLSVGGTGLVAGDTVTLDGVNTMTASAGAPGANQFQVVTTLATLALNIEATARNICDRHNSLYAALGTSPVYAYYTSQGTQVPGLIFVETKQQSGGASPACSRAGAMRLPAIASALTAPNRIRFSKVSRGDAYAPVNELVVGPQQATILRVVPYRDRLLVFTDMGIYQVTGSTPFDFAVSAFDLTYRLAGRGLVAVCDDAVYAWCLEGIVELDEGGARVISASIEPTIFEVIRRCGLAVLGAYGYAVAYRTQHRVVFMYPPDAVSGVRGAIAGLVWDTRTRAWTTMSFNAPNSADDYFKSCGAVRFSDDRLVLGWWNPSGGDGQVFVERRALTASDYVDDDALGVATSIILTATFQFQVPDAEGAVHWQQSVFHFDDSPAQFAWKSRPTSFTVQHQTELLPLSPGIVTVTPTASLARIEAPRIVRRANQLRLVLSHSLSEPCGFVGLSQAFEPATRFARRA